MTKAQDIYNNIKGMSFEISGDLSFENIMKNTFKDRELKKEDKEELFGLINSEFLKELNLTKAKFIKL